jgi:hypothetical protein
MIRPDARVPDTRAGGHRGPVVNYKPAFALTIAYCIAFVALCYATLPLIAAAVTSSSSSSTSSPRSQPATPVVRSERMP